MTRKKWIIWILVCALLNVLVIIIEKLGYRENIHTVCEIILIIVFTDIITDWIYKKE